MDISKLFYIMEKTSWASKKIEKNKGEYGKRDIEKLLRYHNFYWSMYLEMKERDELQHS